MDRLGKKNDPVLRISLENRLPKTLKVKPNISKVTAAVQQKNIIFCYSANLAGKIIVVIALPDMQFVIIKKLLTTQVNEKISDVGMQRVVNIDQPMSGIKE